MPNHRQIQKIMVIGSDRLPTEVGNAADLSICRYLGEEGYSISLLHSDPSSISPKEFGIDSVYSRPLNLDALFQLLEQEKPDAIYLNGEGQIIDELLTLAQEGVLDRWKICILGNKLEAIKISRHPHLFRQLLEQIEEPSLDFHLVSNREEAIKKARFIHYPISLRPIEPLFGAERILCHNESELHRILEYTYPSAKLPYVMETSLQGLKSVTYFVVRDREDTAFLIGNMENMDPVGIHVQDSISFIPCQTLSDRDHQILRQASLKIVRALKIEGACSIQFALDSREQAYYVTKIQPCRQHSLDFLSKVTAYPVNKIATKLAIGKTFEEILDQQTGEPYPICEPSMDYIVAKIPYFPAGADSLLGTKAQSIRHSLGIGRSIQESLLKAQRGQQVAEKHLELKGLKEETDDVLINQIVKAHQTRLYGLMEAIRRGYSIEELAELSKIDIFFLDKLWNIVEMEKELEVNRLNASSLSEAKKLGFSDEKIAHLWQIEEDEIRQLRKELELLPVYKSIGSVKENLEDVFPCYYATYAWENESLPLSHSVACLGALEGCDKRNQDLAVFLVESRLEKLNLDDIGVEKYYLEALIYEDVMNILELEQPDSIYSQHFQELEQVLRELVVKE